MTSTSRRLLAGIAALALAGVTAGCAEDSAESRPTGAPTSVAQPVPDAGDDPAATATRTAAHATRDRSDAVAGYTPGAPVATAAGTVKDGGTAVPVRLEVLTLEAREKSTVLRYRIVPSRDITFTTMPWSPSARCLDGVTLVDPATRDVHAPAAPLSHSADKDQPDCLTPSVPHTAGPTRPLYLYSYYGPMPAGATTMTLRVQGFADTPVPVTRP